MLSSSYNNKSLYFARKSRDQVTILSEKTLEEKKSVDVVKREENVGATQAHLQTNTSNTNFSEKQKSTNNVGVSVTEDDGSQTIVRFKLKKDALRFFQIHLKKYEEILKHQGLINISIQGKCLKCYINFLVHF